MDFVYICRDGENEELRYSIRSVLNSFPEAKVWLVGGKPEWYSGHCVPVEQNSNKYANALKNLKFLCEHPEISDDFVLMNDDFFIIKKINSVDQFYNGLLSDKINRFTQITGSSMYIKKLITTNKKLIDLGIKNPIDYELHTPMPMNKTGLLDVIEKYPECLWRSMFGNLYNVGGTQMDDVKIYVNKKHLARSNEITDSSIYMSTEDTSLKVMLDKMLRQMLPEPSIYEKIK
jgi:hypothetical protein